MPQVQDQSLGNLICSPAHQHCATAAPPPAEFVSIIASYCIAQLNSHLTTHIHTQFPSHSSINLTNYGSLLLTTGGAKSHGNNNDDKNDHVITMIYSKS